MGKYAGSMRTRALSGAETIHVNGEVLEYPNTGEPALLLCLPSPNAIHTAQCRMPYEICRTGVRILSSDIVNGTVYYRNQGKVHTSYSNCVKCLRNGNELLNSANSAEENARQIEPNCTENDVNH